MCAVKLDLHKSRSIIEIIIYLWSTLLAYLRNVTAISSAVRVAALLFRLAQLISAGLVHVVFLLYAGRSS